jgi:trigger factor
LKIETQPREDHQVRLVVEIEQEAMEKFKRQAARKIAHDAKIPGFRPGKAPYDVVRRLYSDQTITNQAIDLLVDEIYPEILEKAEIKPGGPGSLDEIVSLAPPTFAFLVPLAPDVELGDFHGITQEFSMPVVTDVEVEENVQRMRTNYATVEPVERPAEEKDLVYLSSSQTILNPSEGQPTELQKETPMQYIIPTENEEKDEKHPFPGFARQLIGLSANEEKTITYTYPEDASDENLRGKTVEYHVKVDSIKTVRLPDLTDEFAQTLGDIENVDALYKSIKERLETNSSEEYEQNYFTQLIDKVRVISTIKYAPQTLSEEIDEVLRLLERDLARQNIDMATYLKMRQLEKDALIEQEIKPAAIRRLERSLIIDAVGRAEKIQLDPVQLQGIVSQTLSEMQSSGDLKKVQKNLSPERLVESITYDAAARLMNRQVLERLKVIATGQQEEIQTNTSEEPSEPFVDQTVIEDDQSAPEIEIASTEPSADTAENTETETE